jgi:hypothetical protein
MPRLPYLLVAAALSGCGPAGETAPIPAEPGTPFTVSGRVCDDPKLLWLEGARVYTQLLGPNGFEETIGTYTDDEGRWSIDLPTSDRLYDLIVDYNSEVLVTHGVQVRGLGDVTLAEPECYDPPAVDVVTASWADPRAVLQAYGIPTSSLVDGASLPAVDAWLSALTIAETDVVVIGAGALDVFGPWSPVLDASTAAGNAAALRGFVEAGGTLVVTEGSYPVVEALWPDKLDFFGDDAVPGDAAIGPGATLTTEEGPLPMLQGWPVVVAMDAGAAALLAADVTVDQGLVQTPVPGAALLVTFAAGAGRVVFIAWPLDAAWSDGVSELVFPTVMPHMQG